MSDPSPNDPVVPGEPAVERDAKIEELLLIGLDHYFAGRHEQAINVWTRVLFLDRGHARARAYIERARSALAERQRESEELLHRSRVALECGETEAARELLDSAVARGGLQDDALALIARLSRLETAPAGERVGADASTSRAAAGARPVAARRRRSVGRAVGLASLMVAAAGAGALWAWWPVVETYVREWSSFPGATVPVALPSEDLIVPRAAEQALARARGLSAAGRLHDALAMLEQVRPTDPLRAEADRLQADLQRRILATLPSTPARE